MLHWTRQREEGILKMEEQMYGRKEGRKEIVAKKSGWGE